MKTVLLISSFVASSQVGASASAFCLRRLGHEVIILPTTLFGRHPGWGPPGGDRVSPDILRTMWDAVQAQGIKFDAVMSGYMAARDHIDLTAAIIKSVKAGNPDVTVLIDPVKGDDGRLYIPEHRAAAMKDKLTPLADILTPNLYELGYMAGRDLSDVAEIVRAARHIGNDVLVTSVPYGDEIGALWVGETVSYVGHERFGRIPNGGGDSLAACFLAGRLQGLTPQAAQQFAVSSIFDILSKAQKDNLPELPLTLCQNSLTEPHLLPIKDIDL